MVTFEDLKSGRVKPEFGNPEHLAAIKRHLKSQEECKNCDGNGIIEIECSCCAGTGKIKE